MFEEPDGEEVLSYLERVSNWGRWGEDDQAGTLNLITETHRVAAAKLVTTGRTVSCARDLVTAFGDPKSTAQLYWVATGQAFNQPEAVPKTRFGSGDVASAFEFFGLVFHGPNVTHVDAPSHLFWQGKLYNDRPSGLTTSESGAVWCSVMEMSSGVVGRGVLLDIPRAEGVDSLAPGRAVTPEDLEAASAAQNVAIGEGDIVLMRTGRWHESFHVAQSSATIDDPSHWEGMPGWHAACLPWLHNRGISMVGCDVPQEVRPPTYRELPAPVHILGLVKMGMPLIDNCDLEGLASLCAELGRWEFQFIMAPLRIVGGSGSPVNPIAVF